MEGNRKGSIAKRDSLNFGVSYDVHGFSPMLSCGGVGLLVR
jgi:hypothetical protein